MIDQLQGHWRRAWLKTPNVVDHDTCVHWMQVGDLFADIRIPAERPDIRGAQALADLPEAALQCLAKAEGFAGHITMDGDACTWHREINWHGPPENADIGRLVQNTPDRLLEEGVEADYTELWHRADDFPVHAARLYSDTAMAMLVTVGNRFIFGSGPVEPSDHGSLVDQFEHAYVFGHWMGDQGIADLATNPTWQKRAVLQLSGEDVLFAATDFHGDYREERFGKPVEHAALAATG